jgi:hypothetical protein
VRLTKTQHLPKTIRPLITEDVPPQQARQVSKQAEESCHEPQEGLYTKRDRLRVGRNLVSDGSLTTPFSDVGNYFIIRELFGFIPNIFSVVIYRLETET